MKKALFFDIDGTLLMLDYMPPSTSEALKRARSAGHEIVICTGRTMSQIPGILFDYCDGIVSATGACVIRGNELIFEHYMPSETLKRIEDIMEHAGAAVSAQTDSGIVFTVEGRRRTLERFKRLNRPENLVNTFLGSSRVVNSIAEVTNVRKAVYFDSALPVRELSYLLGDVCDVTPSSFKHDEVTSGEFTCRGINKSLGMKKYIEHIGLGHENTVAFGDGANDIDMIKFAGTGVCMGNGCSDLKAAADMITDEIQNDGIFNALLLLGLI